MRRLANDQNDIITGTIINPLRVMNLHFSSDSQTALALRNKSFQGLENDATRLEFD